MFEGGEIAALILQGGLAAAATPHEEGKATRTRFTFDPQMTSQNGICSMHFPFTVRPSPALPSDKMSYFK